MLSTRPPLALLYPANTHRDCFDICWTPAQLACSPSISQQHPASTCAVFHHHLLAPSSKLQHPRAICHGPAACCYDTGYCCAFLSPSSTPNVKQSQQQSRGLQVQQGHRGWLKCTAQQRAQSYSSASYSSLDNGQARSDLRGCLLGAQLFQRGTREEQSLQVLRTCVCNTRCSHRVESAAGSAAR